MGSPASTYRNSDVYVHRMPSPPRIIVDPPKRFDWNDFSPPKSGGAPVQHSLPDFLAGLNINRMQPDVRTNPYSWSYGNRRQAQQLYPFLFLGPMQAAKDKEYLQKEKITLLLAVQFPQGLEAKTFVGPLRVAKELGLESEAIVAADNQGLIAAFPQVTIVINEHLSRRISPDGSTSGKVLIYCESGNERSASVAAAYLMEVFHMDLMTVLDLIQTRRFCVNIDDRMRHTLQAYESILEATRDVSRLQLLGNCSSGVSISPSSRPPKRTFNDVREAPSDMSEAMDYGDDDARFENREFGPFVDS